MFIRDCNEDDFREMLAANPTDDVRQLVETERQRRSVERNRPQRHTGWFLGWLWVGDKVIYSPPAESGY